jgi:phosphoserine phosphatase RsbU/P
MSVIDINNVITSSTVLIVDDNPKNLQVLGAILMQKGIKVEFSVDGPSAMEWLLKKQFDLVLLDVMMPVMDGFEVCRWIKSNPETSDIPVIFITAKVDSASIIQGFETGGIDYISKPFLPSEMLARVKSQLNIQYSKKKLISFAREIEERNRNINDSITYARNIQKAVMHTSLTRVSSPVENFILYLPKDIVSGDFYWFHSFKGKLLVAIMDCTGHGVPGAFMSMLGIALLNEIVIHDGITSPECILDNLRDRLISSLGQNETNSNARIKDGMEGAIINYDIENKILRYAGSFNPLIHIRNNELAKVKADRIPVGLNDLRESFTLQTIKISDGDLIYLYTDGFLDQFGGPQKKKIMAVNFLKFLHSVHSQPMSSQRGSFIEFLSMWKNGFEQTDDILVLGMRF